MAKSESFWLAGDLPGLIRPHAPGVFCDTGVLRGVVPVKVILVASQKVDDPKSKAWNNRDTGDALVEGDGWDGLVKLRDLRIDLRDPEVRRAVVVPWLVHRGLAEPRYASLLGPQEVTRCLPLRWLEDQHG